ncbi:hypothetical protein [Hymenobacter sp.]|uniref:hypothetical protein n=1 Tax=Hymenobacter sp. TaxID=1898978 RepID=UPI00286B043B|nr:hypothetical protein [Hymenobacter sp.]
MKKVCAVLSVVALLAGGLTFPTHAVGLGVASASCATVYPDNDYFFAGLYSGRDFVAVAAATYGSGTPDYYAAVDAEIAYAQEALAASPYGGDDYYYYWGYRTGLRQSR